MGKESSIPKNEYGFVIVLVMLILVFITIIGIAATNTSTIEPGLLVMKNFIKRPFMLRRAEQK